MEIGAAAALNPRADCWKLLSSAIARPQEIALIENDTSVQSNDEYAVERTRADGTQNSYLIYFLLDSDGEWKIDSM